jgi:hypothetical protein
MTRDLQAVETKNMEKRMTKMTPAVITNGLVVLRTVLWDATHQSSNRGVRTFSWIYSGISGVML